MRTRWCSVTNVTEDTTHSVWAWTPYQLVSGWTHNHLTKNGQQTLQKRQKPTCTHKSSMTITHLFACFLKCFFCIFVCLFYSYSFILSVSPGLWVCEVCDKDFTTPKKKGGAKTPKKSKSAKKWSTSSLITNTLAKFCTNAQMSFVKSFQKLSNCVNITSLWSKNKQKCDPSTKYQLDKHNIFTSYYFPLLFMVLKYTGYH